MLQKTYPSLADSPYIGLTISIELKTRLNISIITKKHAVF
ncbi:hypothetical protein M917_0537 [Psychrobacter aquaticus CMS 56]|uniref:Uncharacterized protein n=1 Tax=Psychrobacter aquaticus CMS 56 TaxID=1354303 RepID=U4T8Q4_9GAMM|nr:hypothetical protein M917_0537 [Psychrobacter aquaticus CMS 56]